MPRFFTKLLLNFQLSPPNLCLSGPLPQFPRTVDNLYAQRQQWLLDDEQIGEAEQRVFLRHVLPQTAATRLPALEEVLHDMKLMLASIPLDFTKSLSSLMRDESGRIWCLSGVMETRLVMDLPRFSSSCSIPM